MTTPARRLRSHAKQRGIRNWLSVALLTLVASCAAPPPQTTTAATPVQMVSDTAPPTPSATTPTYLLGVGDEVEVRFGDHAELSETVKVRPDGKLGLQFIGAVDAAGKSPEDIQATIAERFRGLSADSVPAAEKRYVLGADDEIELIFAATPQFNQVVKVRPDGRISLRLVNSVVAQGKTPEDLQAELIEDYRAYLKRPDLVVVLRTYSRTRVMAGNRQLVSGLGELRPLVSVRTMAPQQLFIGGEVLRPGAVAFQAPMTLLQAVIQAGGARPTAELRDVIVLRKVSTGAPLVIHRNLASDVSGGVTNDIYLAPYDVVIVPKTSIAATAETIDQYVFQLLPPLRNTSFGFIYQINRNGNATTVQTSP